MQRNPFHVGQRIRATDACLETAREFSPDDVPAAREGAVTTAGLICFTVTFDDGTVWEATSAGGDDEPIYFEAINA